MVIAGSKQFARTVSTRRVEIIRPKSPKSPAASASALKSAEGSGDAIQNSDNGYMNTNGNMVSSHHHLLLLLVFYSPPLLPALCMLYFVGKIGSVPSKEHIFIYIPSKESVLDIYHQNQNMIHVRS